MSHFITFSFLANPQNPNVIFRTLPKKPKQPKDPNLTEEPEVYDDPKFYELKTI